MSDATPQNGDGGDRPMTDDAGLETMAFRMREIQRLLGMRVEQENRRLEAQGIDPVTRPRFLQDADAGD